MALEYRDEIRINTIAPSFFIGERNRNSLLNEDEPITPRGHTIVSQILMQRFGRAENLQGVALLVSRRCFKFCHLYYNSYSWGI
jgi:hypothetical protein